MNINIPYLKPVIYSIFAVALYLCTLFTISYIFKFAISRFDFSNINDLWIEFIEPSVYLTFILVLLLVNVRKEGFLIKKNISLKTVVIVLLLAISYRVFEDPIFRINLIFEGFDKPEIFASANSLMVNLIRAVNIIILASVFEELLFRKTILNLFKKEGVRFGILFSSFLFAIIHIKNPYFSYSTLITAFIFSIIASMIYMKYNLLYSILFHIFYNSIWYALKLNSELYWTTLEYLNFDYRYWIIYGLGTSFFVLLIWKLLPNFYKLGIISNSK